MAAVQRISSRMKLFSARMSILIATHPFESLFGLPLGLFYGWYILALSGLFYPLFTVSLFLIVGLGILFLLSKRPALFNIPVLLLAVLLCFFALLAYSTHPLELVSEGRDQGTFITSALLLNNFGSFSYSVPEAKTFFALYGPGKALNFPGLAYTKTGDLIPEFPLGYIVWLAGFVSTFGLLGFSVANIFLYLLSGLLFFTLLKRVTPLPWSFLATLIAMGGFLPLWFLSFTLSENLALFFFLLTLESTLRFQINKDKVTLFLALTSALALALTRIEGWAILGIACIIFCYKKRKLECTKALFLPKPFFGVLWIFFAFLLSLWTFWINTPYYKAIAKALLKTTKQTGVVQNLGTDTFPLYKVLWEYGILPVLVLGLVSSWYFWKTRRMQLLIPLFLALPTIPYLLLPHITLDAPWMLRRFLFNLYPALFISTLWGASLLISRFEDKRQGVIWTLMLTLLLGVQVPAMKHFLQTSYQANLLPQVEEIAAFTSPRDLILIDREVTGDTFMMPARMLSIFFNRPSVYFFNTEDLARMNRAEYERILLLTPTEKVSFYETAFGIPLHSLHDFTFVNDHSFRTTSFKANTLPEKNVLRTPVSLVEIP